MLTGNEISKILDNHPYYKSLCDADKLKVLNITISNHYNLVNKKPIDVMLSVVGGKVGEDGKYTTDFKIPELPQRNIEPLGTLSYRDVINQCGMPISALSEEVQKYTMSISTTKIQELQKEIYEISNSSDRVERFAESLLGINSGDILFVLYRKIAESISSISSGFILTGKHLVENIASIKSGYSNPITGKGVFSATSSITPFYSSMITEATENIALINSGFFSAGDGEDINNTAEIAVSYEVVI